MQRKGGEKGHKAPETPVLKDYLHDGEFRLDYAIRKVEGLPEPNRAYALEYKRSMELKNRKARTIARRLHELIFCLKALELDAKKATKKDIEDVVLKIQKSGAAPSSQAMTKLTLKNFFAFLYDIKKKHTYPEIVDEIEINRPRNQKVPEDLLSTEEMTMLTAACKTPRDRCVIAILSTFGCRVGELLALRYKDVLLTNEEVNWITFNGKTGTRKVPWTNASFCFPYIVEYLNSYKPLDKEGKLDPNAPLFVTKDGLPLDYKNVRRLLVHLKNWTGLKKRLHPHIFRFSAATTWAGLISESLLKKYMGWDMGSKMASVYVKMNDKILADGIIRATGSAERVETKPKPSTKKCAKCGTINELANAHCKTCGSGLDSETVLRNAFEYNEEVAKLRRQIANAELGFEIMLSQLDEKTKAKIEKVFADRKIS